jgi:hypothetical protein
VAPAIAAEFPAVAPMLLGSWAEGSEVLGYDDSMSNRLTLEPVRASSGTRLFLYPGVYSCHNADSVHGAGEGGVEAEPVSPGCRLWLQPARPQDAEVLSASAAPDHGLPPRPTPWWVVQLGR